MYMVLNTHTYNHIYRFNVSLQLKYGFTKINVLYTFVIITITIDPCIGVMNIKLKIFL